MKGKTFFYGISALTFLLAVGTHPLLACVVCGTEGSCYDQPSTLSGNCECVTTSKFGALICRPKGVCDPQDALTCNGQPGVLVDTKPDPVIHSRFLEITAAKDPLLAAALWGAIDQERDSRGIALRTHLSPGEHSGTLGTRDHRSFKYQVEVRQFAETMMALSVTLEDERTGETLKYDGALYESGTRGELARMDDGKPVPVVVWDLREGSHRSDREPGSPQN